MTTAFNNENGSREVLAKPQWAEVVRLLENCGHPSKDRPSRLYSDEAGLIRSMIASLTAERDAALADNTVLRSHLADEMGMRATTLARALAAEAENTRLKETVEGLLPQKLCGEISTTPDDERVSITVTFGAIRAARSVLATIPPKENPDA